MPCAAPVTSTVLPSIVMAFPSLDGPFRLSLYHAAVTPGAPRTAPLPREERERRVLDAAAELFYARGVHEVGMDELVRRTGLGKATVYRLFPTKDALVGAYLARLATEVLGLIDGEIGAHADDPAAAVRAIFGAIADDLARPTFRGCAFNNASIEFEDPEHPARAVARAYREALHERLVALGDRIAPGVRSGARRTARAGGRRDVRQRRASRPVRAGSQWPGARRCARRGRVRRCLMRLCVLRAVNSSSVVRRRPAAPARQHPSSPWAWCTRQHEGRCIEGEDVRNPA
jgi:AcrR family transcriptional regulator